MCIQLVHTYCQMWLSAATHGAPVNMMTNHALTVTNRHMPIATSNFSACNKTTIITLQVEAGSMRNSCPRRRWIEEKNVIYSCTLSFKPSIIQYIFGAMGLSFVSLISCFMSIVLPIFFWKSDRLITSRNWLLCLYVHILMYSGNNSSCFRFRGFQWFWQDFLYTFYAFITVNCS